MLFAIAAILTIAACSDSMRLPEDGLERIAVSKGVDANLVSADILDTQKIRNILTAINNNRQEPAKF